MVRVTAPGAFGARHNIPGVGEVVMTVMTTRLRPLGAMLLAVLCAVVLGMTSMLSTVVGYGWDQLTAKLRLLADEGWIMSGTGQPDPTVGPYISQVLANYLQPSTPHFDRQPTFPGDDLVGRSEAHT